MTGHVQRFSLVAFLHVLVAAGAPAQERPAPVLKAETFETDPGWEGHNNRLRPKVDKIVKQDFDHRLTNFAGKDKGEIGGTIWRSPNRAYYAASIPTKTLNDKLSASGTFAL